MFRSHLALILGLATLLVANVSMAQNYKLRAGQKQTLNFEDELVEGSAQKPELFYLSKRRISITHD